MATSPSRQPHGRLVGREARLLFVVYSLLSLAVWEPLYLGSAKTDRYFAWTIKPSLTAAFLGACYGGGFVLNVLSSRERLWERGRVAVPAGLVFTTAMLVATLLHLDRFHLSSSLLVAKGVAWAWLVIYVGVPLLTLAVLLRQLRLPGRTGRRTARLPRALRCLLAAQAAALAGYGATLFVAPLTTASVWPWTLTPLTGRAVGAWLLGLGVAAGHMLWENDRERARAGLLAYACLAALQFVALARYQGTVDWGGARTWVYVVFLASLLATGLSALTKAHGPRRV